MLELLKMFKLTFLVVLLINSANLVDVSYYEILGVSKQATIQEIRQAYKKLAIKFHPDKNPDSTHQDKFLRITEAYETLKDADKRNQYDRFGSYPSYTRKYDYHSQREYNNLYYNGLYHEDPNVDTLSGGMFYNYLQEGFHFINFYSPFCPPCQNLVDHWKKLAEVYKGIIKIGAVNCKYHNSFCYNSMRISSYPSLLFYPNGKNGNYVYYRGDRTFEALERFVLNYLQSKVYVPVVAQLRNTEKPIAYVLGRNRIEENTLLRIAYHLNNLVTVVIVEDEGLREKLTKDEYTTVVFKYKGAVKVIDSIDESVILKEIVHGLPTFELINPDNLKKIRNQLRNGHNTPWVLFFSSQSSDRLQLHQIRLGFPDMHFGEINCDKYGELCISLQVDSPPSWAVLKPGGAFQIAPSSGDIKNFISIAVETTSLHSLSASDFTRILDGDIGTWVLLIVPYQLPWDHLLDPFTKASLHYVDSEEISFGIMLCTMTTDKHCRQFASNNAAIIVQQRNKRHVFNGQVSEIDIEEFIQLLTDNPEVELNEQKILEIMDPRSREHSWLVAFLPTHCGSMCDQLRHEWRRMAAKLQPLEYLKLGTLQCSPSEGGICHNVRSPTARLYPLASGQHYTVSLQNLAQAPYMWEWALGYLDDSVQKLNWNIFTKQVIAEELNPTGDKKPWLVYFHSPRCHRCYEMFADFTIAGDVLRKAVNLGKVNCISERGLCQHEQITSYPSLKLYLPRNKRQRFSSVINIQVNDHKRLIADLKLHIRTFDEDLLDRIELGVRVQGAKIKHDEF